MPAQTIDLAHSVNCAGYKSTAPRQAVLRVVTGMHSPLTAHQILIRARRGYPPLGLVTVYRTLEILLALGHVRRLHLEGGCHTYAVAIAPHSHYLICSRCGAAVEFNQCRMQGMVRGLARRTGYRISAHWLELFGECPRCRRSTPSRTSRHVGVAHAHTPR
jgi:Fe2+ or Zn2+ uptake regulation protein